MDGVIGPSGKDVFAIAYCWREGLAICVQVAMVEAISKDEARGIAHKMTRGIKGEVLICVQGHVGAIPLVPTERRKETSSR